MTETISIVPSTDLILADIAREGVTWQMALSEAIDNSLDAGASRILIELDKKSKRVGVVDNGSGCPEPHKMLVSGYSTKRLARTTLGRFGVGLKHASFYFCGKDGATKIVTLHGSECKQISVVWSRVIESGEWCIEAPTIVEPDEIGAMLPDHKGTSIVFSRVKRQFLSGDQFDELARNLSFAFSPALRSGVQIEFNVAGKRRTLCAPRDPVWSESTEFEVDIGGKKARVRAGILDKSDESKRQGMSISFGHRVVTADSASGCGSYSTQGFAGFIELDRAWELGQNKSSVTDDSFPMLRDAIEIRLRPMLEKLRNSTLQVQSEAFRNDLSNMVNAAMESVRGKAKRPGKHGEERKPKDKDTKRTVRRATVVDGLGDVLGKRRAGGMVSIDYEDDPTSTAAARVDNSGARVYLNKANRGIADLLASNRFDLLIMFACAHLILHNATHGEDANMCVDQYFGDVMGRLIATPNVMDAKSTQ